MAEKHEAPRLLSLACPSSTGSGVNADNVACPTLEETAAIVAVLMLTQREAPPVEGRPRSSAWKQVGRREAVRSWTRNQ